jgi:hypothetical protein
VCATRCDRICWAKPITSFESTDLFCPLLPLTRLRAYQELIGIYPEEQWAEGRNRKPRMRVEIEQIILRLLYLVPLPPLLTDCIPFPHQ